MLDEFITLQQAADDLGVSRFTMWRLIRDGELVAYQAPSDRRRKLIRRVDLEALKQPRALNPKLAA